MSSAGTDETVGADRVRERLREIVDPCSAATGSNLDIVEMGLVKSIDVDGDRVRVEMRLTTPMCHMVPYFNKEVEERLRDLPGIESVEFETDGGFEWSEELMTDEAQRRRQAVLDEHESRYRRECDGAESASDA
ncbi:metal-sulfur cluster assembly factor [Haloterrigena alkaliphila]|uniref:DUF59 domain-containing protein n=1 Tax=Haloterrigena alkaliphila TaxID=2816475 RepID=A0A8A2VCR9_9EURY|nr:iron-sulfur cluster assembly protein [Haloterrigena alkaliphila]QSW98202.1 iron-sulfur cluster assembly protein [Haloterrigena alkaliphila]